MCLCLYFTAVEPRHYLLPRQTSCGEGKNRFDQTHVIDTISQRSDWKMGFCLVRVFIQLFTGQRVEGNHFLDYGLWYLSLNIPWPKIKRIADHRLFQANLSHINFKVWVTVPCEEAFLLASSLSSPFFGEVIEIQSTQTPLLLLILLKLVGWPKRDRNVVELHPEWSLMVRALSEKKMVIGQLNESGSFIHNDRVALFALSIS